MAIPERERSWWRTIGSAMDDKVEKSDEEWRRELTPEQYRVLRDKGTERAFTGALWNDHEPGRFLCAGCSAERFRAEDKFDSGTGWPSFSRPATARAAAPGLEQAAEELKGKLNIGKLKVDENPRTSWLHQMQSIPTLVLQRGPLFVGRVASALPKSQLDAFTDRYV